MIHIVDLIAAGCSPNNFEILSVRGCDLEHSPGQPEDHFIFAAVPLVSHDHIFSLSVQYDKRDGSGGRLGSPENHDPISVRYLTRIPSNAL